MGERACRRDGGAAEFGLTDADGASFDNIGGRELAIEKSRAAPGEATFAQKNVALYLTMPPGAV
jgi:hypothetical protein